MTTFKGMIAGAALALGLASGAQAAIIGGQVSEADFVAALGTASNNGQWSYLGNTAGPFTLPGTGTLELKISTFADSFGYAASPAGPRTTVFAANAAVGATASIAPSFSPFMFYFEANPSGSSDDARRWTDGTATGAAASQTGLNIFLNTVTNTYAFFFDDGGPSGSTWNWGCFCNKPNDDNDFNDLVVTYTPAAIPEPATMALFGAGLLGLGAARRMRRQA